ncbi:MAG: glycosyltransferase family 2 protein [Liquorilactobacillus hordei]|uniref:glycosyltransferase family 2 protein n=1 Tax=Liquorilactobacillus hordei TaxID=468911 RepID=UPI0039EB78A7
MTKISVIMPVYNAENFISNTLDSILRQTFQEFELILINDGSTDSTADICKEKAAQDKRIKYYEQSNHGISYTRNRGLALVEGDYVTFCDHDDIYNRDLLFDNYKLINSCNADIVKFGRKLVVKDKIYKTFFTDEVPYIIDENNIKKEFSSLSKGPLLLYVWDSLIKKDFLTKNNIVFDESFKSGEEDRNFMFACISKKPRIVINPQYYYTHYIRGKENATSNFSLNRLNAVIVSAINEQKLINELEIDNQIWSNELVEYFVLYLREIAKNSQTLSVKTLNNYIALFCDQFEIEELKLKEISGMKNKFISVILKNKLYSFLYIIILLKNNFN